MGVRRLRFIYNAREPIQLHSFLEGVLPIEIRKFSDIGKVSNSKIRRLIVAGSVSVSGRQERNPGRNLWHGAEVNVDYDAEKFAFEKKPDDIAFDLSAADVLFEDDDLIVINKPARLPSDSTQVESRDTLHACVKRYLFQRDGGRNIPYVGVHHRLDRETSGAILFSKRRSANAALFQAFADHRVRKVYEALASSATKGFPAGKKFRVENELNRISPKGAAAKWGAVESGGLAAVTDFEIFRVSDGGSLVRACPLTGRTHQIRVHLSGVGLPILGDSLYGGASSLSGIAISRVMLHARELTFPHPETGLEIRVVAPLADDFSACETALSLS